jgi:hypothetical protein
LPEPARINQKPLSLAQCPSRFPFISNREFRIPHSAFRNPRF